MCLVHKIQIPSYVSYRVEEKFNVCEMKGIFYLVMEISKYLRHNEGFLFKFHNRLLTIFIVFFL